MKEQIISYKTAELAKRKEFDEECRFYYTLPSKTLHDNAEDLDAGEIDDYFNRCPSKYSAPTQALLQKWLRKKHNLIIEIEALWGNIEKTKISFACWILYTKEEESRNPKDEAPSYYKTYEKALEKGLQEALTLVLI